MKSTLYLYRLQPAHMSTSEMLYTIAIKNRFRGSNSDGFKVTVNEKEQVWADYFVREEKLDEIVAPNGQKIKNALVRFDQTSIRAHQGSSIVYIVNPGRRFRRSLENFQPHLSEPPRRLIPDFTVILAELPTLFPECEVRSVELDTSPIKGRTACRIHFSAFTDVMEDIAYFLGSRKRTIRKIGFKFNHQGSDTTIELNSTGRIASNLDFSSSLHLDFLQELSSRMILS